MHHPSEKLANSGTFLYRHHSSDDLRFGDEWANRQNHVIPSRLNEMLVKVKPQSKRPALAHRGEYCESIRLRVSTGTPQQGPQHSKIEMFVCQPPVKSVMFEFHYYKGYTRRRIHKTYGTASVRATITNDDGVTFGNVLQAFVAAVKKKGDWHEEERYTICAQRSILWMMGAIFPMAAEVVEVESKL